MRLHLLAPWAVLALSGPSFGQLAPPDAPKGASTRSDDTAESSSPSVVREQILPGTEEHSPSTLGASVGDPRTVRRAPGATGSVGVLHVLSADLGRQGLLRLSGLGEYFNRGDFPVIGASDTRSAGTFALSYVALDWLELYASYSATANSNSTSSPNLIASLGDVGVGAKLAGRFGSAFYGGLDLRGNSYASPGNQNLRGSAGALSSQLIATIDLREAAGWPLRLHGNFGAAFDNTRNVLTANALNAAELYALNINGYHRLTLGVAAEAPLPFLSPFVEYGVRLPLGVSRGLLVGPDGVLVPLRRVLPQVVSTGVKITAIRDVTLIGGVDFGLTRLVGLGVPATPPYNIVFGAAFNTDLFSHGETRVVEKIVTTPPSAPSESSKTGRVAGTVVDARTKKPVAGAIVSLIGSQMPPVATDAKSGTFVSQELPSGRMRLSVQKEGYRVAEHDVLLEGGRTATVELRLEALIKRAQFVISVTSKMHPIVATVSLKGPEHIEVPMSGAFMGTAKAEGPAGEYLVAVTARGYLSQTRKVQASEGGETVLSFDLWPKPKKPLVVVRQDRIETLQQIHFETGKATVLADSFSLLAQVVDAIVSDGLRRIRIEGHTDNRGNPKSNLRLSEQRARAVAQYLERSGIERERLQTVGLGDSRPIAPNLTAHGRELNRRVELVIVER